MSWLVIRRCSPVLAFQNSAARCFYAMVAPGAAVLAGPGERAGAPWTTVVTSVISLAVILTFAITGRDPVLNLFYWFSGLAVIAIVPVEILVSVAVVASSPGTGGEASVWASVFAPLLSIGGLLVGLWLLMRRGSHCWPARSGRRRPDDAAVGAQRDRVDAGARPLSRSWSGRSSASCG